MTPIKFETNICHNSSSLRKYPILPVYSGSPIAIIVIRPKEKSVAPTTGLMETVLIITPNPIKIPAVIDLQFFTMFISIFYFGNFTLVKRSFI